MIRQSLLLSALSAVLVCLLLSPAWGQEFSWQKTHAKVIPTGDLEWTPEPFVFQAGREVRYIDFAGGSDKNPGTKDQPWKHHPWDPASTGRAKADTQADTYVFKSGVVYRGHLRAPKGAGGTQRTPLRLTRDPSWGSGQALISGSEVVTGWTKGSEHPDIPEGDKVWKVRLDYAPRGLWQMDQDGQARRIPLARTPNWEVSDPQDVMSQWWQWENPQWWKHMSLPDKRSKISNGVYGIDTTNLTEDAEYYEGATVRTEWGIVMGMPMPSRVERFDPETKALAFTTPFLGPGILIKGHRYFLEDKPHYLDSPGEYWFDKQGTGGTLYLRLKADADPRKVTLEAAKRINLLDATGLENVEISGLSFGFSNYVWEQWLFIFQDRDMLGAAIRNLGPARNIRISNCTFRHVNKAIRIEALTGTDTIDGISITDNDIRYTDHGGIHVKSNAPRKGTAADCSRLGRVDLLRNRLYEIGLRFPHMGHEHAVNLRYPEQVHVAGNFLHRTYQGGMDIAGTKGHGQGVDAPFCRMIIHHNKIVDPILASNDWGALYINQGGPGYVFDNVVRNPGGYASWRDQQNKKTGTPRFGHCYYLDGSYQKYVFNNIAWGANNELGSKYANESAFQTLISFQNRIFNNTAYRFVQASRNQSPQLGRWTYLGNIYQDVSELVFRHGKPAKGDQDPNAADAGKQGSNFDYATIAYANNILHHITGHVGVFEHTGQVYDDPQAMAKALEQRSALRSELGIISDQAPLRDPENFDMRPVPGSGVDGRGAKVFVPWGLYAEVGQWHFHQNKAHPGKITDSHWYMQSPYPERQHYIHMPRYPLQADWAGARSYQGGQLEDWVDSALRFQGTPAVLTPEALNQGATYTDKRRGEVTVGPEEFKTVDMQDNNFLIEIYFRARRGNRGMLVSKFKDRKGYLLAIAPDGRAVFQVMASKISAVTSDEKVNDGKWHHLLAEVDRRAGKMRIFLDGNPVREADCSLPAGVSLSNEAPFEVGRDYQGLIDFLRVSRGTLADARTNIQELRAWQFDGPQLRDFNGIAPNGKGRDAGAIEGP